MKSIDEIFGESWHKDWQELPDTCKAWLIEKNRACGSGMPQEKTIDKVYGESRHVGWSTILEKDWNQHPQTLSQLSDPEHTNIRRQKIEMLVFKLSKEYPFVILEIERRHNTMLKAIFEYEEMLGNCDEAEYAQNSEERERLEERLVVRIDEEFSKARSASAIKAIEVKTEKLSRAKEYALEQVRSRDFHSINSAANDLYEECNRIAIEDGVKRKRTVGLSKKEFPFTFTSWLTSELKEKITAKKK